MIKQKLEQVAKALEALGQRYGIPENELVPIAKMCGEAIAQGGLPDAGAAPAAAPEAMPPMDTGADELTGALGGR